MISQAPIVDPYNYMTTLRAGEPPYHISRPRRLLQCVKGADACGVQPPREHEAPAKPKTRGQDPTRRPERRRVRAGRGAPPMMPGRGD